MSHISNISAFAGCPAAAGASHSKSNSQSSHLQQPGIFIRSKYSLCVNIHFICSDILDWVSWHLVSFWGEPTRCKWLPPSQAVQQRAHAKTGNNNAVANSIQNWKIIIKLPSLVVEYSNISDENQFEGGFSLNNRAGRLVSTTMKFSTKSNNAMTTWLNGSFFWAKTARPYER